MNKQEELWAGEFGDAYQKRNRVDWRARIPFWKRVLNVTGARSVTEIGCACGWNLSAIHRAFPDINLCGIEINEYAAQQAKDAGLRIGHPTRICGFCEVTPEPGKYYECMRAPCGFMDESSRIKYPAAELVLTAGVLIHQEGDALKAMMQAIVNASYQYVLAVEYPASEEEHIKYRGMDGYLWKRPYGRLYRALGLKELASWPVTKLDGFDDCQVWLLTKF